MDRSKTLFLKGSIILIGLIILVTCFSVLPRLADIASNQNPGFAYLRIPVLIGIYVTAIPFLLALYHAYKLLNDIECDNAFSKRTVNSLISITKCSLTVILLYVMGMIVLAYLHALHPGIAIIGISIIFSTLIIAVFTNVLLELLINALTLKTENDLTV